MKDSVDRVSDKNDTNIKIENNIQKIYEVEQVMPDNNEYIKIT